jgi:asparagine synthase (glutamine-hydrolysing)
MRMFYEGFLGTYDNSLLGLNLRVHNNAILTKYFAKGPLSELEEGWLESKLQDTKPKGWEEWNLLQRNQHLEMRTLLQGYLLSSQADRMSLAHGIEGRYPFLDHELVDWAFHLPESYKLPLLSQKHLLREAFRGQIPTPIIDRPKQPYQAPDLSSFFSDGRFSPLVTDLLSPAALSGTGLFEPNMVERFLTKIERRAGEHAGYRDNMLICFLLSSQLLATQCAKEEQARPPTSRRTVDTIRENRAA